MDTPKLEPKEQENSHEKELGDSSIEQRFRSLMNDLARKLDTFFNGPLKGELRKTGFVLMVFPFEGEEEGRDDLSQRCHYISNANREDVIKLLKEQAKKFEKQSALWQKEKKKRERFARERARKRS